MKRISLVVGLVSCVISCEASHFRGGTISWKPTGNLYEAEFKYRLGWRYGHGHGCDETLINQYVDSSHSRWTCSSGCASVVVTSSAGYICLAASQGENWELGEYSFMYQFSGPGPFTISFTGGAWISLSYGAGGGSWSIETIVDFGSRSDTSLPNYSPVVSGKPTYTIMYGCTEDIQLPVLDQDNDNVQCRWATEPSECGSVCHAIPSAALDMATCTLTIEANYTRGGIYAVAIIAEDYPTTSITIDGKTYTTNDVISKTPYQFLVETPDIASRSCTDKPVFVTPSPEKSTTVYVQQGHLMSLAFYATSPGTEIASFLTIGPPGVNQSTIDSDPTRTEVYTVNVTWTPTSDNDDRETLCLEATDTLGITSELYCLTLEFDIDDIDECESVCCLNGGSCINTVGSAICVCPPGITGEICQTNHCQSQPCQNGGLCVYNETRGYECECVNGWRGIHCDHRHEKKTHIDSDDAFATDYMHYSSCNCYFGNGKQQLCYKNQTSAGYGVLGAMLGILTVVLLYIIVDGCFHKQLFCFNAEYVDDENKIKIAHEKSSIEEQHVEESMEDKTMREEMYDEDSLEEKSSVEVHDAPVAKESETRTKPDNVRRHKHRKCWACDMKYNNQSLPTTWMVD